MNPPYLVVSIICDFLVDPNVPEYGEDLNSFKKRFDGSYARRFGAHDVNLVPYDLLRLARVNRTFYEVFMSDIAWKRFGSGPAVAENYLKTKSRVPPELWDFSCVRDLLDAGKWGSNYYQSQFTQQYIHNNTPRVLNALYFVYTSRASSGEAQVPEGFELDLETCKLWLKNTAYFEPTPLFYKHLPPQLQRRSVVLELLPLGLSLKDLPLVYGNREAFEQLCKLPYAGIRHSPTEITRLFKDFIYDNLALLMDIVYIDFSVLSNAPLAILQNRDTMIEICKRNPECILIAHDPRNGRVMRLGLDPILEIMERLEGIDKSRCDISCYTIIDHFGVDPKTFDMMIARTTSQWLRQVLIRGRHYFVEPHRFENQLAM